MKKNNLISKLIGVLLITSVLNVYSNEYPKFRIQTNSNNNFKFHNKNLLNLSSPFENENSPLYIKNAKIASSDKTGFQFSGNGELWYAISEGYKGVFFGASFGAIKAISGGFSLGASIGYVFHSESEEFFGTKVTATTSLIPILIKARYYISQETSGFYPEAALGVTTVMVRISGGGASISASTTKLTFGGGVGYKLDNGLDFSGSFNIITTQGGSLNALALRIGYWF
jgi:hypothetical protein